MENNNIKNRKYNSLRSTGKRREESIYYAAGGNSIKGFEVINVYSSFI